MKLNILSRLVYAGLYAFLNIILGVLLLVTPGDAISQALDNSQIYNIFVIAGCYFLTLFLAITLYTSRLYSDSASLKAIPKTWIPVENGDVNKKVRKMVVASLSRSAAIAWNSRPRLPRERTIDSSELLNRAPSSTVDQTVDINPGRRPRHNRTDSKKSDSADMTIQSYPVWGEIVHDGWSSPMSLYFPNLQYITVILELPHLIEAKAISLISPNSDRSSYSFSMHTRAVEILKRPAVMGLREYVNYLSSLDIVSTPDAAIEFISLYEYSRFSTKPLSEQEFKKLMERFTEILRAMKPLNPEMVTSDKDSMDEDYDIDSELAMSSETPESQEPKSEHSNTNSIRSGSRSNGTIRRSHSLFYEADENLSEGVDYAFRGYST